MLYQQNFSNGQELLITIKSRDADLTEHAASSIAKDLRAATNLVSRVNWQPPWLENPGEGAELIAYLWLNQPPEIFSELKDRLTGKTLTNTLIETRELLSTSFSPETIAMRGYDPLNLTELPEQVGAGAQSFGGGNEFFSSADGTFRIVFAQPAYPLSNYRLAEAWLASVQSIAAKTVAALDAPEQIELGYTGQPAFVAEIASGMQKDMRNSVMGTMGIIAVLFWIAHRRFRPLLWLLVLLALVLGGTLAFGGLLFGTLNVVSLGFAAILLGLAVDYGLILYQEARISGKPIADVRRMVTPSILWAGATTAGAFAILNFSGLPGLGQLGSLVAIGVLLAGCVMLWAYLPALQNTLAAAGKRDKADRMDGIVKSKTKTIAMVLSITAGVMALIILVNRPPSFDQSPEALRPKNSSAYSTLESIKTELGQTQEPLWIVVSGANEAEILERLRRTGTFLESAVSNNLVSSYTLATPLWPSPKNQTANREHAAEIVASRTNLHSAVLAHGFTADSLHLADAMLNTWEKALNQTNVFWPGNPTSQWTMNQLTARRGTNFLALGLIYPATGKFGTEFTASKRLMQSWPSEFNNNGILLSGWTVLGAAMFNLVERDLRQVVLPMLFLLIVALWMAFRSFKEVVLSFLSLIVASLSLFAVMSLTGQSWNLMNMMAIPLLLGVAVDYSIHILHAMRRCHGDIATVQKSVGRALLLCSGTTIAGFGSLAFSSNAGMASLGLICAIGIAANVVTAVYFLPYWWHAITRR